MLGNQLQIWGKPLFTGREKIYSEIFLLLKEKWFFGYGSNIFYLGRFSSAHNSLLGFWATLGLFPLITVIGLFVNTYSIIDDNHFNTNIIKYLFLIVLFLSIFETFLNDPRTNTISLLLLPLCNLKAKKLRIRK